jgi:Domain of unknown function (DUF5011)/S-layer homology domain
MVQAVANTGYTFIKWSDNNIQPIRTDWWITWDTTITWQFVLTYLLPVITINGTWNLIINQWTPYSEPGANRSDFTDWTGTILIATSWTVNTNVVGTYTLEYSFTNTLWYTTKTTKIISVIAQSNWWGGWWWGWSIGTWLIVTIRTGSTTTWNTTTWIVLLPPTTWNNTWPTTWVIVAVNSTTPTSALIWAVEKTVAVIPWQVAVIPTQPNPALTTQSTCYTPKEFSTITLWTQQVEKDILVYQWLLYSYGLTKFTDTDEYKPNNGLKRNEAAKMLVEFARNILCRQKNTTYANQYTDIATSDATLKSYIIDAYEFGIMKWNGSTFRPNDTITRQEFVASLMRMFTNKYLEEANKDWFENYETAFGSYWLNTILSTNNQTDRYDISKILYKLYYDQNYTWTVAGYVLGVDGKKTLTKPAPADIPPAIIPIDVIKPLVPTVTITPILTPNTVIMNEPSAQWNLWESLTQKIIAIQVWQKAEVILEKNIILETKKVCYIPPASVTITLWAQEVPKDILAYQWLLHSYWLTKFTDTDSYKPKNWLKRYEAAKIFVEFARNVLCRQKTASYNNQYTDITDIDPTLKPYIIEAYEYGIMQWWNNIFRPTADITNQEFIAILVRMFTNTNLDIPSQWNNWDIRYKQIYQNYWLDTIITFDQNIDRYNMSKILYKMYFDPTYTWTDAWYVLPIK